uniref:Small nuclear ribonucleoprotein Sm D3 n=1 Tax=Neovison vison TaxID=452646 RepID=A0A8C7BTK1_NEOVI
MSIGVPIKVLHEAEGHIVTCETNTGEVYRGKLIEAEDNMNCQMSNITVTYRDGRVAQLEQVYIRGSKIRFLILPDMLKNAPMLKSMKNKNQGSGAGRGKAAILKAQGMCSSCPGFNVFVLYLLGKGGPCQLAGPGVDLDLAISTLTATLQPWGPHM